jgi:hypothetical protein
VRSRFEASDGGADKARRTASKDKHIAVAGGCSQYDLYDRPELVILAVARVVTRSNSTMMLRGSLVNGAMRSSEKKASASAEWQTPSNDARPANDDSVVAAEGLVA